MQILEFGKYYHIYNRGINSCNLFEEASNYEYFLRLYEKYILPIADTYAWRLMPNHPPVRQAGIHHNPVKHGFTEDMIEYPWSSYLSALSPKETNLKRQQVIDWFDNLDNLKSFHQQEHNLDRIKHLI